MPPPAGPSADRWLLSYADFTTLLLALFVVLYASARSAAPEAATLFEGLQAAFDAPAPERIDGRVRPEPPGPEPISPLDRLETELADAIASVPRSAATDPGISLERTERGLVIRLATTEFFPAGGVEIPEDRRAALRAMAPLLVGLPAGLQFEGHTDDRPVGDGPFPSNWELSAARASAMARLFMAEHALDPGRVTIVGHAAERPIASATDLDGRARNRRVEIVVRDDASALAPSREAEGRSLDRLLDVLPPLAEEADERLKAVPPPAPAADLPLP